MKSPIPTAALKRFQAADEAWMKEIAKLPGRPGDVRYTKAARGEPGTALRAAHDEFVAAGDAWRIEARMPASASQEVPV